VSGCAAVNLVGRDTGVGLVPGTTTFSVNFDGGVPTAGIGAFAGPNPNDPYRLPAPLNVNYDAAPGSRTIQVSLADELGNLAQAQATFTVDNNPPAQPVFTSPAPGVYNAWSVVSLGAQATDPSTGVEEIRFYVASNAPSNARAAPYWHHAAPAGQRGLLQVGSVTGSAGSVSFRVPDPTNEDSNDLNRALDLIALAIDSAGNANGNSLNITVRHTASQRIGVDMTAADGIGNNGTDLELFFLQPPSGTRVGVHALARTGPGFATYIPEAAQVGVSLYEAEYRGIGTSTFFNEGSAAQVSFYFLSAPEDPFQAVIDTAGGPAALNLPPYVGLGTVVYNLIADVQALPFRATFALPPTRAIVALVFNEFGHSIPFDRGANVGSGPIFQVRALECPEGPYSISTTTPLDGTYNVQIFNNIAGVPDRFEFLYQRTGMAAPDRLRTPPPPGTPLGAQGIPATGIVRAGPDPNTGAPGLGFHGGRANLFDPNNYAPPQFGAGTYTQFLRVFEDFPPAGFNAGDPVALLNLCPTFQVTN
jgi:hypothetical protein